MTAQDVEYVELYTRDERSAVDYFVSSFGFTPIAEAGGNGAHSSLLRQGTAQLIITAGRGTEEFLEAHGDGIADIAFACDDAMLTRDRALAAGAVAIASRDSGTSRSGGPVVSGLFGACHTLVTARAGNHFPAGRAWVPVPGHLVPGHLVPGHLVPGHLVPGVPRPPVRSAGHIQLLDHVAVCVESGTLADSADFYTSAFGLPRYSSDYTEFGDQAMDSIVVRSPSGRVTFTILEQDLTKKAGQIEAFLSRNSGPGVQHLAFLVDDIVSAVSYYADRGVDFLRAPGAYYDMLADRLPGIRGEIARLRTVNVLADCDEWGYLLQLFTCSPYERNTMFYEFVQRRGARGFGSANIRALYEAVERNVA